MRPSEPSRMTTQGLLLAAGAGTRMGRPKALVSDADGSWLERGVRILDDGGCEGVTVVLGARSSEAVSFLDGLGCRPRHRPRLGVRHVGVALRRSAGDALRGDRGPRSPGRPPRPHRRRGQAGARRGRRSGLARAGVVRRQARPPGPARPRPLGRRRWPPRPATVAPATTWRPTTRSRSSAATSRPVWTSTHPPTRTNAVASVAWKEQTGPPRRSLSACAAPATSPTTRWPRSRSSR